MADKIDMVLGKGLDGKPVLEAYVDGRFVGVVEGNISVVKGIVTVSLIGAALPKMPEDG